MSSQLPDFVYAGASRCGSTWLHRALRDHPEITMAPEKPFNFFDLNYHRGLDWYADALPDGSADTIVGESSPGYMKHPHVPERIAGAEPGMKILFTVRNPVDRAFSEWWHERSFDNLRWEFEGALEHHPAFDMLLRPGFYDCFLDRFEGQFDDAQLKILFFEDFKQDNEAFIREAYRFLGVGDGYVPSLIGERVNEANHLPPRLNRFKSWVHHNAPTGLCESILEPAYQPLKSLLESDSPYRQGVPEDLRAELEAVFVDDVRRLEERTGRDLSHWYRHV